MATRAEMTFHIDAEPATVCAAMRNPQLINESERSRDAREVKITPMTETEAEHAYEIFVLSPARGIAGIDPTKTEENRTRVRWDLRTHAGEWVWSGAHGPKVKVSGAYALTPAGAGSRLVLTADISVGIPLVGSVAERKIRSSFEQAWPAYVDIVRKYATAS